MLDIHLRDRKRFERIRNITRVIHIKEYLSKKLEMGRWIEQRGNDMKTLIMKGKTEDVR